MMRRVDGGTGSLPSRLLQQPIGKATHLFQPKYQIVKRCLDFTFSLFLLLLVCPLLVVIAALIWLDDPGPVLLKQWRTGRAGRRFRMYKFRTMVTNADALKAKYAQLNELTWPDFKITNDPRITKIGRILRTTSLDELPQLINVLKGDMSLVGPRPTSFDADTYELWQTERLEVLPGITGLWQVSGRATIDFEERSRLDASYIRHRSLGLDLSILAKTVRAVISRRGAG